MKNLFILAAGLLSLFVSPRLSAQKSINYFDQAPQNGPHCRVYCAQKSQQYVYLGGTSFDSLGLYYTPTVVKVDTAGNTIWTATVSNQLDTIGGGTGYIYWAAYVQSITLDDSSLYVHVISNGTALNEIWRVDMTTGDVVWRKSVTDAAVLNVSGSTTIAYTYNIAINYYTNNYIYEMADKATGKTLYTTTISPEGESAGSCFLSYDTDGTAYIIKGDSVIKYSDAQLSTVIWNKKMGSPGGLTVVSMQSDGMYFAGNGPTFFAGKLNKADGSIAWMTYSSISSYTLADYVSDFKVINNGVYVLGQDMDPGNGYSAYHVAKFNRTSGTVAWESDYNPQWATVGAANAGDASGNSVDVDTLGNAYVTGYEGGSNSRTGIMGVVKFDSTGRFVYHSAIFDGAPFASSMSRGMFADVFDNKVFYFGDLQRSTPAPTPEVNGAWNDVYMVATDTGSVFNPYRLQKTRSLYQEFSNVLDIENFSSGKYAVLKQLGLSVSVEMRDSRQGTLLWTQTLQRGFYLAADKLVISADNKIAVTAISHDHSSTYYNHSITPDSLYLFRFDSTGVLKQENRYVVSQDVDLRSIQLIATTDTNLVLAFSQVDHYGNDNSVHLYNFDKGTGNIGDWGDYLSSVYAPVPGKQQLFYPIPGGAAMHFQWYSPINEGSQLLYKLFTFTNSGGGGWDDGTLKLTGLADVVHNITPCDSTSVIALANTYPGGVNTLIHYNTSAMSTLWTVTDASPGYSMDMGSCSATSIYLAGRKGNSLVIRKVRTADGSLVWEKLIAPVGANQYYIPKDQKFNSQRNQYTIAGYIADTTAIVPAQSAFYLTVDTNGTMVNQWIQAGNYKLQNSLNTVHITQYGQTLIGGALYTTPYGRSGVFIEADSALTVQPVTVTIQVIPGDSVCQGDSVMLIAQATGCGTCTYSWSTSPAVASDTLVVKTSGSYTVTANNGTNTGSATQTVTVVSVPKPTISLSNGMLTSSSATGDHWYLNGQVLVGADSQQLKPLVSGQYAVQVMQAGCQSPISDAITYTATTADSSFVVSITSSPGDSVCAGDSVQLTASVAGCSNCTFTWSVAPVVTGPSLIVRNSGTYTVTATTGTDTASGAQTVMVTPRPVQPTIQAVGSQLLSSATGANQWYLNWIALPDSIAQQISPSASGIYTVAAIQNGCPSPMSIEFPYMVTAPAVSSQDSIVLYPNPVKDILHISNTSQRAVHIGLFDVNGKKYAEISTSAATEDINISSYAPGGYYVMITDDKTGAQTSMMIIKI